MEGYLNRDITGHPSARPFGGSAQVRRSGYNHLEVGESFHTSQVAPFSNAVESDTCGDCLCPEAGFSGISCPCHEAPHLLDEDDPLLMSCDDTYVDAVFLEISDHLYSLSGETPPARGQKDPDKEMCVGCGKSGHFIRDCPSDGGGGTSKAGQRYGTARGFKLGDRVEERNPKWAQWREKANREYGEKQRTSKPQRTPPRNGGIAVGKFGTHARRLRTGHATSPTVNRYQLLRQYNVFLAEQAEKLGLRDAEKGNSDLYSHLMTDK
jgi:hypothetical protein